MPDEMWRGLAKLALDAMYDAPAKPQKVTVRVESRIILAMQAECDRIGLDWRKHHRQLGGKP